MLSYARWQDRHDADPNILGHLITLDDVSHSVIGVMPEGFYFPDRETEIWIPLTLTMPQQRPGDRFIMVFSGLARLRDGVSLAQAEAEGRTIVGRQAPLAPGMGAPTLRLVGFHDEMVRRGAAGAPRLDGCRRLRAPESRWRTSRICCWRGAPVGSVSSPSVRRSAPVAVA